LLPKNEIIFSNKAELRRAVIDYPEKSLARRVKKKRKKLGRSW
jgi:hypothetical protein